MDKMQPHKRIKFMHNNQTVYEWEQTLTDVHLFINPPKNTSAKQIQCTITASTFRIGLKNNTPFLDETFQHTVDSTDSFWTMEDGEIHITLTKGSRGVTWLCLFKGHAQVDAHTQSEIQKSLMLERFQAENPGFDFSGASFNGSVPDAKTFMGGLAYK